MESYWSVQQKRNMKTAAWDLIMGYFILLLFSSFKMWRIWEDGVGKWNISRGKLQWLVQRKDFPFKRYLAFFLVMRFFFWLCCLASDMAFWHFGKKIHLCFFNTFLLSTSTSIFFWYTQEKSFFFGIYCSNIYPHSSNLFVLVLFLHICRSARISMWWILTIDCKFWWL